MGRTKKAADAKMRTRGTTLPPVLDAEVENLFLASNVSPAEIIRMCVDDALPRVREKLKLIVASRPKIGVAIVLASSIAMASEARPVGLEPTTSGFEAHWPLRRRSPRRKAKSTPRNARKSSRARPSSAKDRTRNENRKHSKTAKTT